MSQPSVIVRDVQVVNRGTIRIADVYIKDGIIDKIATAIGHSADIEID